MYMYMFCQINTYAHDVDHLKWNCVVLPKTDRQACHCFLLKAVMDAFELKLWSTYVFSTFLPSPQTSVENYTLFSCEWLSRSHQIKLSSFLIYNSTFFRYIFYFSQRDL